MLWLVLSLLLLLAFFPFLQCFYLKYFISFFSISEGPSHKFSSILYLFYQISEISQSITSHWWFYIDINMLHVIGQSIVYAPYDEGIYWIYIWVFFLKKNDFCCRCPHVHVNIKKNDEKSISYVVGIFFGSFIFLLRCN